MAPRPGGGTDPDGPFRPAAAGIGWRRWHEAAPAERAIAVGALALTVAWVPGLDVGSWVTGMAVALVVGGGGLALLGWRAIGAGAGRPAGERLGAGLLLAWLAVGLASSLASPRPLLALFGLYGTSTGWLFMVALAGCWALGTALRDHGRALLSAAVVTGAAVNAVVAVLQLTVGLDRIGLPLCNGGQPLGLQGNPVFLGALEAGALVLLAATCRRARPDRWRWAVVVVVAVAVGAAGERMSLLVALVVAACMVVDGWRAPARGAAGTRSRPSLTFAGLVVAGLVAGTLLPTVRGTLELGTKLSASTEGTFGDRLHAWLEGLRAVAHQPLLGAGPGQFQAATSALFPVWFDRSGQVFADAHDILVEYAVTTGLLGLACLVGWAAAACWGRRGALLGFAAALAVVELVEPLNATVTPLLFLAVGAAASTATVGARQPERGRRRRALRVATAGATALAVLLAADLVVGSRAMVDAESNRLVARHQAAQADARLADRLLAPWPESAHEMALVALVGIQASPTAPTPLALAAHWEQVAAGRDPSAGQQWAAVAELQLRLKRFGVARRDATVALRSFPWNTGALQVLGTVALDTHDRPAARRWFSRLVTVRPRPSLAVLMEGGCAAGSLGQSTAAVLGGRCTEP